MYGYYYSMNVSEGSSLSATSSSIAGPGATKGGSKVPQVDVGTSTSLLSLPSASASLSISIEPDSLAARYNPYLDQLLDHILSYETIFRKKLKVQFDAAEAEAEKQKVVVGGFSLSLSTDKGKGNVVSPADSTDKLIHVSACSLIFELDYLAQVSNNEEKAFFLAANPLHQSMVQPLFLKVYEVLGFVHFFTVTENVEDADDVASADGPSTVDTSFNSHMADSRTTLTMSSRKLKKCVFGWRNIKRIDCWCTLHSTYVPQACIVVDATIERYFVYIFTDGLVLLFVFSMTEGLWSPRLSVLMNCMHMMGI